VCSVLSPFRPESLLQVYGILERRPCTYTVNLSTGTANKLVVFCVESADFCAQIEPLRAQIKVVINFDVKVLIRVYSKQASDVNSFCLRSSALK
jgi:hypothetical protein